MPLTRRGRGLRIISAQRGFSSLAVGVLVGVGTAVLGAEEPAPLAAWTTSVAVARRRPAARPGAPIFSCSTTSSGRSEQRRAATAASR